MNEYEFGLTRAEVPAYIEKNFGKGAVVKSSTLAKLAVVGGGPKFRRYGRKIDYLPSWIDEWILSRRSNAMSSTSDTGGNHA